MATGTTRGLKGMEIEEKLLNVGAVIGLIGVCLPWIGGSWMAGDNVSHSGLGFYTGFIGAGIFLLHLFLLAVSLVPAFGGPVLLRRRHREIARLWASIQATLLTLAVLTVLMRLSFEFTRMEVRFGIYITLVGSILAVFESTVRYLEFRRTLGQETFHHPEDQTPAADAPERTTPVPPPPPPPPEPPLEEHRLYR